MALTLQVPDEEVQDWRAGGGGSQIEQVRVLGTVEQRPAAGAGQVRTRVADRSPALSLSPRCSL